MALRDQHLEQETLPAQPSAFLSVKQAALIIGVSARSVYGYIEKGELSTVRAGNAILLPFEAIQQYQRRTPGRQRKSTPAWHIAPGNRQYVTSIRARVGAGKREALEQKLAQIRAAGKHLLPGTVARYIVYDQARNEIDITLVWCSATLSATKEHEADLADLCNELADVLEWETVAVREGEVLMYA